MKGNAIALSLLTICGAGTIAKSTENRPNIVFFYVDDLGWMDLSCQGSKFYETPNIDRLASQGMRFTNAYSAFARCLPARYGVLTGKFPARGGVPGRGHLRPDDLTLGEALQEGGYKTCFIGKWHLTGDVGEKNLPKNQGFNVSIAAGAPGSPDTYFYPYRTIHKNEKLQGDAAIGLDDKIIPDLDEGGKEGEYLTDRLTNEAIKFMNSHLKENRGQPFLLYLSHYGVHTPLEAKKEIIEKYEKKLRTIEFNVPEYLPAGKGQVKMRQDNPVYAAMIESIDQSMGRILEALDELGIADNTVVFFSSDNGGLSNRGNNNRILSTSNFPLRNGKGWGYEGGIRVPLIVRWPKVVKEDSLCSEPVIGVDFYPTMLEIAGIPLKPEHHIDGVSFKNALLGNKFERKKPLFWHEPTARPNQTGEDNFSAMRLGNFKLIEWTDNGKLELYDLAIDIGENNDISTTMPEKTQELLRILNEWRKEVNAFTRKTKEKEKGKREKNKNKINSKNEEDRE
ncbi:MAG TPA: sulfatase [Victivallales bacterium]|nr:sulfatase [Victivallales bacterium]